MGRSRRFVEKEVMRSEDNQKIIKPKKNLDDLFLLIEQGLKIFGSNPAPRKKINCDKNLL